MRRRDLIQGVVAGALLAVAPAVCATPSLYLAADTRRRTLILARGARPVRVVRPLAHGTGGVAQYRRIGSEVTPSGRYRIGWVNTASRFRLFFGLNYPLPHQARRALAQGLIGASEHDEILHAHARGDVPPQNTALGGYIGLHGLGGRSRRIHSLTNWTDGCLAVTDAEIDALSEHLAIGTPVLIA